MAGATICQPEHLRTTAHHDSVLHIYRSSGPQPAPPCPPHRCLPSAACTPRTRTSGAARQPRLCRRPRGKLAVHAREVAACVCEAHCFPLLTCHQTGAKAWRLSSPCALPVLTCPAHSIGGSQLSRDAELEQLWKQPEVLRKIFRCRQRGWCDADHIWEMLGKACQSGNACLLVAARPQDLPALASTGAQTACIQPASQQPRLHTLPPVQPVRQPVRAPAAAAGRGGQAAAAAADHEEAVRRWLGPAWPFGLLLGTRTV